MDQSETVNGVKEVTLASWTEFFVLANACFARAPAYVYRGQANYSWKLRSTLDRDQLEHPERKKRKNLSEGSPSEFDCPPLTIEEHLAAFKRAIRGRRGDHPPLVSDDDYWALGQHHGLRTPLLDFTRSAYAALFFAFEEAKVVIDERMVEPEWRGVYALSTSVISQPSKLSKERVTIVSPESDTNFRLISQGGILVHLPAEVELESYVRANFPSYTHDAVLTKVKIPNNDRIGCLVALDKMNINHMTLFPDLDGAAKHVNAFWEPGRENSLAYV